jgi:hypothetical protein
MAPAAVQAGPVGRDAGGLEGIVMIQCKQMHRGFDRARLAGTNGSGHGLIDTERGVKSRPSRW